MQSEEQTYQIYNYPDIFSEYFFNGESDDIRPCPEYTLIFVFSGKLIITCRNRETMIRKGEYVFLRKDTDMFLKYGAHDDEAFSSVFMGFGYNFLREFYQNMKKKDACEKTKNFPANIIKLPCNPYLESMYISLHPYLYRNIQPIEQIVEIKLTEAVFSLLLTDETFYGYLFDFPNTGNKALTNDYAIKKLTYDNSKGFSYPKLSASHLRNKQTGEISCLQCTITKKLKSDFIRLHHENAAINIYMEADYKNDTRFTRIFDRTYDFTMPN